MPREEGVPGMETVKVGVDFWEGAPWGVLETEGEPLVEGEGDTES